MNKISFKKGVTLAELMVVLGIFGLIMITVANFQKDVITNTKFSTDSLSSIQDARIILKLMVSELRSASPGTDGSFALAQVATNTITFYSDSDDDGLKEKIRYYISTSTNTLMRGAIKPTGPPYVYNNANETFTTLAHDIKNATSTALFEYYDNNYAGTSSPLSSPIIITKVHLIKINLMIDADPNRSPIPRIFTSEVSLRNLKDNL